MSLGLGLGLARLLRMLGGTLPPLVAASPELLSLTGLAGVAWLVAVLSFAWPVALGVQVGVSALAVAVLVAQPGEVVQLLRTYGQHWRVAGAAAGALAAVLVAGVLVHAVQPPSFIDTTLYHAQTIQWLHRFAVVPGLGNLHSRLAFNSHADLLTAFFSPASQLGAQPAFQQTVNSYGFLLLTLCHVRRAAQHLRPGGRPWLAGYYLGSLLLLLLCTRFLISSPMPDMSAAMVGLLLLGALLETPRLTAAGLAWLVVLTATAVTFKASAVAMLLWPLAWALRANSRDWGRRLSLLMAIGLVVALPWLGRNVVLSGYAVYPLAASLGAVVPDWAIPTPRPAADMAEIRLFALRPANDWSHAAGQSLAQWLPFWWQQHELADQRLLLILLASLTIMAGSLVWQRRTRWWQRVEYQLYGLLLLDCGWWFGVAPALRFGYTYVIGVAVLGLVLAGQTWPARWLRVGGWLLVMLTLAYGVKDLGSELNKHNTLMTHAVWPADYRTERAIVVEQLGPYRVYVGAHDGHCGNSALPCTDTLYAGLQLRGATLQQGFRMSAPAAEVRTRR
ncbi:hypothetical protein A8B98_08345 [Hymenobacter sp. UV11]|nr:hypothetical protein A8B98_08345 [Hymenobacter sp. UV11]